MFTAREKAMAKAKEAGEEAFSNNKYDDTPYEKDPVLKSEYVRGWRIAEADYYRFYSNY